MRKKVLVAERIADEAMELLKKNFEVDFINNIPREELLGCIHNYDGLIVRSVTKADEELMAKGVKLKMIGRAGNGTDNIDVSAATKHGIIAANTPDSNTMSAAEHTIAMMLTQSRNIPHANQFLKTGKWGRNQFNGSELYMKTLGIIGLGRIGSLVAARMKAFEMNVIAYDPYIPVERFERLGVQRCETLEGLLEQSDYITVHTPKNKETFHMIHEGHLPIMKDGVRLTNVARGGIIKEKAIVEGVQSGKIRSAAIDVHEVEPCYDSPLYEHENIIVTPHLGANTTEAQLNVGMMVAQQMIAGLNGEIVPNALNLPTLHREELKALRPFIDLTEKLGRIYYPLYREPASQVVVEYYGDLAGQDTRMLSIALLKGLLETVVSERVNYINAELIAKQRGIVFEERKCPEYFNSHTQYVRVLIQNPYDQVILGGCIASNGEGRLAEIDGYEIDIAPGDTMLVVRNLDVPGVVGSVGTILGKHRVNVATMQLGRHRAGDNALMVLNLDGCPREECVLELTGHTDILEARIVAL